MSLIEVMIDDQDVLGAPLEMNQVHATSVVTLF